MTTVDSLTLRIALVHLANLTLIGLTCEALIYLACVALVRLSCVTLIRLAVMILSLLTVCITVLGLIVRILVVSGSMGHFDCVASIVDIRHRDADILIAIWAR